MITTVFGAEQGYRKLAPTRLLPIGSSKLLEGRDHLLHVELKGVHETHKRFYFSEVRAISIQPSKTGLILHVLVGASAAILALGLAAILLLGSPFLARLVPLIAALLVILAGLWLIHLLRGPTCSCHLITAVQNERIPALWRSRVTNKTLKALAPRIQAAQSQLALATDQSADRTKEATEQVPLFTAPATPPRVNARWAVAVTMSMFSLCLANAGVLFGNLLRTHIAFDIAETLLLIALLGVPLLAIVGNRTNRTLRLLGWAVLLSSLVAFLGWYGLQLWEAVTRGQTEGPFRTAGSSPYRSAYTLWMTVGSAVWYLVLGLTGWLLIVLQKPGPASPKPGELPPTPGSSEGDASKEHET